MRRRARGAHQARPPRLRSLAGDRDDDKDFFERVMFVVSKDENLTKAHARFLESQLIRAVKAAVERH